MDFNISCPLNLICISKIIFIAFSFFFDSLFQTLMFKYCEEAIFNVNNLQFYVFHKYFSNKDSPCSLPKKIGPCKGHFPRFFYNKISKRCEKFYWGGCEPHANNFEYLEECLKACKQGKNSGGYRIRIHCIVCI